MNKLFLSFCLLLVSFAAGAQERLPQVVLKDMGGKSVQTDTISNGGKPMVIAFFAIDEVYDEWQRETGVRLVAVSIDQAQNINKVKPLVDQNGWRYDVLLDPNGELRRALGIQMIPFTVLLDGKGNIVYKHNGYTEGAEAELIEKVRELIK